jgi:hypothetical protein
LEHEVYVTQDRFVRPRVIASGQISKYNFAAPGPELRRGIGCNMRKWLLRKSGRIFKKTFNGIHLARNQKLVHEGRRKYNTSDSTFAALFNNKFIMYVKEDA